MERAIDDPVEEDIQILHTDTREEVDRCMNGEWTVDLARQSNKPLQDITRDAKQKLKTRIRGTGV